MKKTRTHYAVVNSSVSAVIFIINTLLKFISRSIFVYFLGKTYLGINSLFGSVIGMLSLSELGIGSAIVYSLYKPLAEENHSKVKSLMHLYKKIYGIIGIIVAIIGIFLLPFIPSLTSNAKIPHLTYIYLLFLFNSVVSYFFSYNRSLLNADQKNYIITINDFIFSVLTIVGQIFILWITQDFICYQYVAIFFTIIGNIVLKKKVDQQYVYLEDINPVKLDRETKIELKKNTLGNLAGKIGTVIVMTTDNIYISLFSGVIKVGMYNNYMLVINAANAFVGQIMSSLTGTLGNLSVDKDSVKSFLVYKKNHFINYIITTIFSVSFLYLLDDFVKLWLGTDYTLSYSTVILIIISYILLTYRNVTINFITAYGLTWHIRWKVFWECLFNIIFSAYFLIVLHLGLNGVILGTICSSLFIVEWWEPYILFKYGFKMSLKPFIKIVSRQLISLLLVMGIVGIVTQNIIVNSWLLLIIKGIIIVCITIVLLSIFYWRTPEMHYVRSLLRMIFNKIRGRS